jgi:hypothetical protein
MPRRGRSVLASLVFVALAPPDTHAQAPPELTWYGYVKMDASWDQGLINSGNFARWVVSPDVFEAHSHFNMTARQTRLGFSVRTAAGGAAVTARLESDFYGGGAENKNALQVRHAFVEASWPSGWSILAGQASDVVSPLNPGTLNYTVAWWGGNVGYRRPQLRVTRRVDLGGGKEFRIQAAATRTIGDDFVSAEPGDSGADAALPTVQGLVGLTVPVGGRPLSLGAYAHHGRENLHCELGGEPVDLSSSSWGAYLTLPLGAVALNGEAWTGWNLDDYLGGIGQGIRVADQMAENVGGRGGWAELSVKHGAASLRAGAGIDDPDDDDLWVSARARNTVVWGTAVRDAGGGLSYGMEVSRWETTYVQSTTGTSWRVQGSVTFTF